MIRQTSGRRAFVACNTAFLGLLALSFILPMVALLSTSMVSQLEYQQRGSLILIPRSLDFTAYRILLDPNSMVWGAYRNTIVRVVLGTGINMLVTCMLAYALSNKKLPGRGLMTTFVLIPMFVSGGLVPSYLLVNALGLIDTMGALILPGAMSIWNMLLMRNFFLSIPVELEESALLDGASPGRILWSVILPLSLASIATIGMFYAVGHWNAWFDAAIYINTNSKLPMQNVMRNIVQQYTVSNLDAMGLNDEKLLTQTPMETLQNAVVIVATLPILVIYPFIQKYFIKGVMVGSLKG